MRSLPRRESVVGPPSKLRGGKGYDDASVETTNTNRGEEDGWLGSGEFLKIKASLDLRKPLLCGMRVKFSDTNYGKVMFQYEKLHAFYYSCDMVGHGGCLKASPDKRRYKGADAEEGVRTNDKRRVMSVNTTVADDVNSPVDVQDSV
ncbi:hypothetical protein LguiB_005421 [Lonicera macranthoides]